MHREQLLKSKDGIPPKQPNSEADLPDSNLASPFYKQQEDFYLKKNSRNENYRNEIKSYIIRAGMTMTEVVDYLCDEYGWSRSVPNLSGKLKRGSLRYGESVELADALGYDIVWQKRRDAR